MDFYNCSDDEIIATYLDHEFNDQPPSGVLQNVGYADTPIYSTRNDFTPMVVTECTTYGIHHLREKFGLLNSESSHCRVIDIINQCRYIASKHGMSKKEIIASMKQDELEGRTYVSSFSGKATSGGLSPTLGGFQGNVLLVPADEAPDFAYYPSSTQRAFGARCDTGCCFPFRHENEVSLGDCSIHNTLLDPIYLDGESDFDQSETSELLNEMRRGGKQESKEEKSVSSGIPPSRKSATLDLLKEGEVYKESFESQPHPKVNKEAVMKNTPARATKSNCTAKDLMVSTARIKACASFVQIMKKEQSEKKVLPADDLKESEEHPKFKDGQAQKKGQ